MKRSPIYTYYRFGYNYFFLKYRTLGHSVHDILIPQLKDFFAQLKDLNLEVTNIAAKDLNKLLTRVEKMPSTIKVDAELAKEIEVAVKSLDKTLDSELMLRHAFILTKKRFSTDDLMYNPQNLLTKSNFSVLPKIVQFDFGEACRCISFDLPTSAAFHLMRSAEGTLRLYYTSIVKRDRVDPLLWGPIIQHLQRRSDSPKKSLTDNLDNIRTNYRNPTQHPEATYDIDEAQDLLSLTIDVINKMLKDLIDRGKLEL